MGWEGICIFASAGALILVLGMYGLYRLFNPLFQQQQRDWEALQARRRNKEK